MSEDILRMKDKYGLECKIRKCITIRRANRKIKHTGRRTCERTRRRLGWKIEIQRLRGFFGLGFAIFAVREGINAQCLGKTSWEC